ncbi:MAG: sodium:solute symporter family protein [Chloroflexota bacterium]
MTLKVFLLLSYLIVLIGLSVLARRKIPQTPEGYFLANRSLGLLVLFFSLVATNFSAFFFLGFAGAAWKTGFGQYGIMGVGTALVPLAFYVIGRPVWKLGKQKGYLTAPELIGGEFNSRFLRWLVMVVMVVFTLPYLLTQAIGAGILLSSLFNVDLLRAGGAATILAIGATVVFGGMKASAWTDVLQGFLMIVAMILAVVFVSAGLGGWQNAGETAFLASPQHFTRPGPDQFFQITTWFSYLLLWTFVNPLFPQVFSRFYAAKTLDSLKKVTWLYPLLVSFLFLAPVTIGVWARGTSLSVSNPDMILPAMVLSYAPEWVYVFVMIGAMAALMSTADSQLLALATMFSHDFGIDRNSTRAGRWLALGLCVLIALFLLSGLNPQIPIFTLLTQTTFAGLIALTPATLAALYFPQVHKIAPILSIIIGEVIVILLRTKIIPTLGFVDGIVVLVAASLTLLVVHRIEAALRRVTPLRD